MKCWYLIDTICDRPPGICEGCERYEDWRKEREKMTEGEFAPFIEGLIRAEEHDRKLLKPCPCCGSTKIHVVAPDDGCYCWECGLTMPNRPNWRERWNRRVNE